MDCLFETKTKYTWEEFKRFNQVITRKGRRVRIIAGVAMGLVLLAEAFLLRNMFLAIFTVIFVPLWLVLVFLLNKRSIKKAFEANKLLRDADVAFQFYDTYFVEKTSFGETRVTYEMLDRIVEIPTNVYILVSRNQGCVLCKENFPEGLEEFLRALPVKHV